MNLKITLAALISITFFNMTAQDQLPSDAKKLADKFLKPKNISKTNILFGPFFKTPMVSQERALNDRISVQTTVRTRIPSSFHAPFLTKANNDGESYNPFSSTKMSGIGNITEFRLYGKEKGVFHGLYGGVFFSYMHYKLESASFPAEFHDDNGVTYKADVTQTVKLNFTGGGFHFGVQGMIKDRICIDWTILGAGVSLVGLKAGIDATNTSANFDFRNYTEDVEKTTFGVEKVLPVKKTVEKESIAIGIKAPWILVRMGLSIGFAY